MKKLSSAENGAPARARRSRSPRSRGSSVVSKQRIAEHGEVLTGELEVDAMLALVHSETQRIDSRFLEPACGDGNFLAEILERKLTVVESRYRKSQLEYERYAVLAVSSVYGIDILNDNVQQCRARLYNRFESRYSRLFKTRVKANCLKSAQFILNRNIVWGDALTLKTVDQTPRHIVFSEWSLFNGSMLKRRDFHFHSLLESEGFMELPLQSDLGQDVFIPMPDKEHRPVHFLELADAYDQ